MEEKLDKIKVWTNNHSHHGMGFFGWLALVFIVLKLTGYINWSWWYVLAPIWAPAVAILSLLAIVLGVLAVYAYFDKKQSKETADIDSYTIIISKDPIEEKTDTVTDKNTAETGAKKKKSKRKPRTKENGGESITTEKSGSTQGTETANK